MDKETTPRRRHTALRPEYLALGYLAEGPSPAHGYELYRRFQASLDSVWHISESQFYTILSRLEDRGLVRSAEPEKGSGAQKHPLSLTPEGEKAFFAWLDEPTASSPRLLHLEFLARLYFTSHIQPSRVPELIRAQSDVLMADLSRLEASQLSGSTSSGPAHVPQADLPSAPPQAPYGSLDSASIERCSADFRCRQLRAALAWLEKTICQINRQP